MKKNSITNEPQKEFVNMDNMDLKQLNVNIGALTYSFIRLFYETNCKYSCTKSKVGKLLSILAFKYAVNGEKLFDSDINKYDGCGTFIKDAAKYLLLDEYSCICQDHKQYISESLTEPVGLSFFNQFRYEQASKKYYKVPLDAEEQVEDVFRNFGSFSQGDLGKLLNPIAEKVTSESYGQINLSKIPIILDELDQDNELVKYLNLSKTNKCKIKKK